MKGFEKFLFQKQIRCLNDESGVPKGSRTPVAWMKTRSPRPLDDGDTYLSYYFRELKP